MEEFSFLGELLFNWIGHNFLIKMREIFILGIFINILVKREAAIEIAWSWVYVLQVLYLFHLFYMTNTVVYSLVGYLMPIGDSLNWKDQGFMACVILIFALIFTLVPLWLSNKTYLGISCITKSARKYLQKKSSIR